MQVSAKEKSSAGDPPCITFTSPPQELVFLMKLLTWGSPGVSQKIHPAPGYSLVCIYFEFPCLDDNSSEIEKAAGRCMCLQPEGWLEFRAPGLVPGVLAARTTLWSPLLRGWCCMAAGGATSTPFLFLLRQCAEHLGLLPPAPSGLLSLHKFWVPAVPEAVGAAGGQELGGSVLGVHPSR